MRTEEVIDHELMRSLENHARMHVHRLPPEGFSQADSTVDAP
jgi:hypothetical protein